MLSGCHCHSTVRSLHIIVVGCFGHTPGFSSRQWCCWCHCWAIVAWIQLNIVVLFVPFAGLSFGVNEFTGAFCGVSAADVASFTVFSQLHPHPGTMFDCAKFWVHTAHLAYFERAHIQTIEVLSHNAILLIILSVCHSSRLCFTSMRVRFAYSAGSSGSTNSSPFSSASLRRRSFSASRALASASAFRFSSCALSLRSFCSFFLSSSATQS